jgi:hypothetical protein
MFIRATVLSMLAALLVACGGGGGSAGSSGSTGSTGSAGSTAITTSTATVATVSNLAITSSVSQINADGSNSAVLAVTVIDASNALMPGVTVTLSAIGGVLSASSGVTDVNGQLRLNFSSGPIDRSNRVATITAGAGGRSAQTSVQVAGGTLSLDTGGISTLIAGGATLPLTATLRDSAGQVVSGATVSFSVSDSSRLSVSAASQSSNSSGQASVSLTGLSAGTVILTAAANGISTPVPLSVSPAGAGFYFLSPSNGSVVSTGAANTISVQAGTATSVQFVTNLGLFSNASNVQLVAVAGGVATTNITFASAGQATIQANNSGAVSVSSTLALSASPPVASTNKLLLTANKTNVPTSAAGGQLNSIELKARAIFNSAGVDVSVFNVPVLFTMSGGPGAGERLSSALVYTNAAGEAITNFYSGTQSSTQNGVNIHAQILGTAVGTGVAPSGNDLALTIGGQALSVAFSPATVIRSSADNTFYEFDFSALVSDANGAAVNGQFVSLSVKPYAFTVGTNACAAGTTSTLTFCSEDRNGNGSLDAAEDGIRILLPYGLNPISCTALSYVGTLNTQLTPPNSRAGTVPNTVTSGTNGIAPFTLTYLKSSAVWVVVELTATVNSAGTEAKTSSIFRLPPSSTDVSDPANCPLPASPFAE